jgi:phenylacetate-CoA ligase
MNVSMSLAEVGLLKSIGPDAQKLENTLRVFGPSYHYLVFGYPPFVKSFVDGATLDLKPFHLDLVVGGEGISENLRHYLLRTFRSVISSYGASDLEINLGVETEFTMHLRQRCVADPALCRELFGRENAPMIFQHNPLDYIVETLPTGEMAFTVCREDGAAPKIRYDLKDVGGTMTYAAVARLLRKKGIGERDLARRRTHFPILYVFGRADLTVAFYGAKIYPADLESVVLGEPGLAGAVHSFQFSSHEDEHADRRLVIDLEINAGSTLETGADELAALFYRGLSASNQDFREVSRMFRPESIEVRTHALGTGPFAGADVRIKSRYIANPT